MLVYTGRRTRCNHTYSDFETLVCQGHRIFNLQNLLSARTHQDYVSYRSPAVVAGDDNSPGTIIGCAAPGEDLGCVEQHTARATTVGEWNTTTQHGKETCSDGRWSAHTIASKITFFQTLDHHAVEFISYLHMQTHAQQNL